ncbi:CAF17-like 4Fe-4S cluster assembly/insertion protein YgfZ [Tunturiibacter lichenicola]|uniref:CAF17-like 4Fe-4S cluster assembly/insertion protein YgfZ n=1 Tax=Tunturiibacter lichenicola TaxID=2051959 RepID=UPI0021B3C028|nr:folate-binding protein [Edaphobacter lichenicola]
MTSSTQSDPAVSSTSGSASQLSALLRGAGISSLENVGWIRVTGEDRVRWLNGMVTNSIQALSPGEGTYNFLLSVQGRIQGDATIFAGTDDLLMETEASQVAGLVALLDRFIIMDDVELADITANRSGLSLVGPQAASLLQKIGVPADGLKPLSMHTIPWGDAEVSVVHAYSPLVPRYELWADAATVAKLYSALSTAEATHCEDQALNWLRMLEGTPLYGTDIRDRELPQETGQTRALHFAKGCYLGQEIVERIRSRGNVHRTFSGFRLDGELPTAGAPLEADSKQVGELTSVAAIPLPDEIGGTIQLALGYVRREALDRGIPIVYSGGVALPVSLPFSAAAASELLAASETSERV